MPSLENARWELFAQRIVNGVSQREAYRTAYPSARKWKDSTVDSKASVLAHTDKVLARLHELREQLEDRCIMSAKERMVALTEIARSKGEESVDRIRAIDTMNKMDGQYVAKVQVSAAEEEKSKLDGLIMQLRGGDGRSE